MKKIFFAVALLLFAPFTYADDLEDLVYDVVNKLIPENNDLIEVETPTYDETFAGSEFSVYLKETIEYVLSDCDKELFDMDMDSEWDASLADMFDSGYLSGKNSSVVSRKVKSGTLSTKFSKRKNRVDIVLTYYNGTKKTKRISISASDIPDMEYEPENLEHAQKIYADVKQAESIAKRDKDKTIPICAAMLDSEKNMVDILYPSSRVSFMIGSPEKDAYIAVLNISAEGKKFWLIKNQFIPAGETWESPKFRPADNVYGQELIYVYAASSPDGLPTTDSDTEYLPDTITAGARELVFDNGGDDIATGVFAITYTVLPDPVE